MEYHKRLNVTVTAYGPLQVSPWPTNDGRYSHLKLLEEKLIKDLSEKYGKTPAQIVLNWHLHRGHVLIPKTANPQRLGENFNIFDFTLTEEEYLQITGLNANARFYDPIYFYDFGWRNTPYFH